MSEKSPGPEERPSARPESLDEAAVDRLVRLSLEPSSGAEERLLARSLLLEQDPPPRSWSWSWAAGTLAALALLLWLQGRPESGPPSTLATSKLETIEVLVEAEPAYRVANERGVVTVSAPSGRVKTIIAGGMS